MRCWVLAVLTCLTVSGLLRADGGIRSIQEELRRRNLYFGDIDGQMSEQLRAALKRYQERKGLSVTGETDEETSSSLRVTIPAAVKAQPVHGWPDTTVLKSDEAPKISEAQQQALQEKAIAELIVDPPDPPPPAESPPKSQELSPDRIKNLVEAFLRDAETDDVDLQIRYFDFPVAYFDHGTVGRDFVRLDTLNYVKRWPERHYVLEGPITAQPKKDNETSVEFTITFSVKNKRNAVTGKTRNYWSVRADSLDSVKIFQIRERRTRE